MAHSAPSTPKQNSTLFRFTLLKFWQPATGNPPTKKEASALIDKCFAWLDAKNSGDTSEMANMKKLIVAEVRDKWFPDWDGSALGVRFRRKKHKPDYEKPEDNNSGDRREETDSSDDSDGGDNNADGRSSGSGSDGQPNRPGDRPSDGNGDNSGSSAGDGDDGDDGNGNATGSGGDSANGKPADPPCPNCDGKGGTPAQPCPECGGTSPSRADADCPECDGHGGGNGESCPECGGRAPHNGGWTCPECGEQNANEENECANCGADKPEQPDSGEGDDNGEDGGTCPDGANGSDGDGEDGQPDSPDSAESDDSDGGDNDADGRGSDSDGQPDSPDSAESDEDRDLDPVLRELIQRIKAGLRNFYLFGPAGTGKTTLAKQLGAILSNRDFLGYQWPVTVLSCNAGTSPSEIRGFYFPERRHSVVTQALTMPGIIVWDEYTTLDPSVAAGGNALLANGEIETSMGNIKRHEHCVIIVTSNTLGTGADREYIGNNQLDAATLDRFVGGYIEVNYNLDYERQYDKQVVDFIWLLRKTISENGYRRVVSTRAIQACHALKRAGLEWKSKAVASWTPEERLTIAGWGDSTEKKLFGALPY